MKQFTPFSDDVIFFDAEFTQLDIIRGELMSVGMITLDGKKELYLELDYDANHASPWVVEHVIPYMTGTTVSHAEAQALIEDLCGHTEPHLVATVNQWDMAFWHKFFGGKEEPINRIPIDFASILFAMGINPARTIDDEKETFYMQYGIDLNKYNMHNALDDAKLMRDLYIKLSGPSMH